MALERVKLVLEKFRELERFTAPKRKKLKKEEEQLYYKYLNELYSEIEVPSKSAKRIATELDTLREKVEKIRNEYIGEAKNIFTQPKANSLLLEQVKEVYERKMREVESAREEAEREIGLEINKIIRGKYAFCALEIEREMYGFLSFKNAALYIRNKLRDNYIKQVDLELPDPVKLQSDFSNLEYK